MVVKNSEPVRPWRGLSPQERVAARRERLLEAGLERFTADGFHGVSVRGLCGEAGLTERYFYESFADKEALLAALAEQIVADFVAAVAPALALLRTDFAAAADGAARGMITSVTDDPRRARILFVEVVGASPAMEDRRRAIIGSLVDVVRTAVADAFGPWAHESVEVAILARAVIGGTQELIVAHVRGELPLDREALIANVRRLFENAQPVFTSLASQAV